MKYINKKSMMLIIFFFILLTGQGYSWEIYDRVIAVVNDTPIIQSEVNNKLQRLSGPNKNLPAKHSPVEKSRLLDKLIEESIVKETANRESIIVSDEKINNQIKQIMQRNNFTSLEAFKKEIEKKENMSFEDFKDEIKKSTMTEQVMSIAIGVSPPSAKEAETWYNQNKDKVGWEINLQNILIRMKNDSFEENKRANKIAADILNKVSAGQSFEGAAKEFSEDNTTKNSGGKMGWIYLTNLAKKDVILANNIYGEFIMSRKKYAVLKSEEGYHVMKLIGSRITSFETAKDDIFNLLYQKKVAEQFKKWIADRRKMSDIKIYMEDYVKENTQVKSAPVRSEG